MTSPTNRHNHPQRVGIFGGTFDPPHLGHLIIAEAAREQLHLDLIIFMVACVPPHKRHRASAPALDRLAMVRLALRGNAPLVVSDLEIRRGGISYTVDTLRVLRKRFPRARFYLLMGSDNASQLHTWKSSKEIVRSVTLAVYERVRAKKEKKPFGAGVVGLVGPSLNISSSEIRRLVRERRSVRYLLPPGVLRFINSKRLYTRS